VNNIMRIFIYIIMMVSISVSAEVYRVSPTNDIQSVVMKLKAGDEVVFSAGKYRQRVVLNKIKGIEEKPVVIRGESGAVIVPNEQDGILIQNSEYIKINGFEISEAWRAGILVFASKYIEVEKAVLKNNGKWGLQTCLSDFVSVIDCDISGSKREHGIYFSTTDHPVVKNCKVYNNRGCGIHFNGDKSEGGDGMISDGIVINNIIYGNGAGGGAAINMDSAERMIIQDNKIYGNRAGGITSFCEDGARAGAGNKIINNSVKFEKGVGRYALQLLNGSTNSIIKGNRLICGRGPALEMDRKSLSGLVCERNVFKVLGRSETVLIDDEWMTVKEVREK
jgi:parallel beta-helix repeat protein